MFYNAVRDSERQREFFSTTRDSSEEDSQLAVQHFHQEFSSGLCERERVNNS